MPFKTLTLPLVSVFIVSVSSRPMCGSVKSLKGHEPNVNAYYRSSSFTGLNLRSHSPKLL